MVAVGRHSKYRDNSDDGGAHDDFDQSIAAQLVNASCTTNALATCVSRGVKRSRLTVAIAIMPKKRVTFANNRRP